MDVRVVSLCVLFVSVFATENDYFAYKWTEKWYEGMPIDHFSAADNRTFNVRYLINADHWDADNSGPIFFYAGNEMRIEGFANNSGFMWDLAPEFNALLIFIEHRYYGKTKPFGDESYTKLSNLGYLSADQAMADFAQILTWLKETTPGAAKSPVISFGGSYGAMLAAWMRIKYPHVITGAYSSSGPVLMFPNMVPCSTHAQVTTRTFAKSGPNCDKNIRNSWAAIRRLAKTAAGRDFLSAQYRLCDKDKLKTESDVDSLIDVIIGAYGNMAMLDYPYPTFFVKPLPTYPVKAACRCYNNDSFVTDRNTAASLWCTMNIWYNHTGDLQCLSTSEGDDTFGAWPFQTCTDQVLPMCYNGVTDMYEPMPYDQQKHSDQCFEQYGVRPKHKWPAIDFGGKKLQWATNIIFSNGDLDPWSGGGVTEPYPGMHPSVHIQYITNAAHHLDLRAENPLDPIQVQLARQQQRQILRRWVQYKF